MGNIVEVAKVNELEPGQSKFIEVEGKEIALFRCESGYYAIDNECPHVGGPLCEGDIDGDVVTCPWHGAEFDLKSGEVLAPPAEEGVNSYRVHIEGDIIKIEI